MEGDIVPHLASRLLVGLRYQATVLMAVQQLFFVIKWQIAISLRSGKEALDLRSSPRTSFQWESHTSLVMFHLPPLSLLKAETHP